ncbi:MAG: N-acetylmuramoyl-L-alanine amidase [Gammaproteobacteria bacterium]
MRISWIIALFCLSLPAMAGQVQLENIRIWAAPDSTRIVFDVSGPAQHSLEMLTGPHRAVVDLQNIRIIKPLTQPGSADKYLRRVRSAVHNRDDLRVVFDLKKQVETKIFMLPPNRRYGHRLVIDLYDEEKKERHSIKSAKLAPNQLRDVVIAIDAGHGGEDPGAHGPKGINEKDVVLKIAKKLAVMINNERGMKAILIREGDYFMRLRKRINRAREHKADLFISVHADAFKDPSVRGSSVYILSSKGASSEAARWLAEQENASDLIGGVSLDDKDDLLATVLLDLSQTASLEASIDVADRVLGGLKKLGKVHKQKVHAAGFAVLKSPDVPSILVETAYISNPAEERKLRDPGYQSKLAGAILSGLQGYFRDHAPEGTMLASRKHVITRGDTLSAIAHYYQISMKQLRKSNGLKGDHIRIGQVLMIPEGGDS